jgi:hypothetical protein
MKKLAILLTLISQSTNVFSQEQSSKKQYSVMKQTIANVTFIDTIFSGAEAPINMASEESRKKLFGVYEANETSNNGKPWVYDDIPAIATVSINGIRFESKKILKNMSDYQIYKIKKDSLYALTYNPKIGEYTGKASYLRPQWSIKSMKIYPSILSFLNLIHLNKYDIDVPLIRPFWMFLIQRVVFRHSQNQE